ncbi:MAG: hypothetical protein RSE00_03610 [Clostridia bacterium]
MDFKKIDLKKINFKKLYVFTFIILFIFLALLIIYRIDLSRARCDKRPIFCIKIKTYDDGGSGEYIGLGYKIIDYNATYGRKDTTSGTLFLKYDPKIDNYVESIDKSVETQKDKVDTENLAEVDKEIEEIEIKKGASNTYNIIGHIVTIAKDSIYVKSDLKYSISNGSTIKITPDTKILKNGNPINFKDLQESDKLKIITTKDIENSKGGATARYIRVYN